MAGGLMWSVTRMTKSMCYELWLRVYMPSNSAFSRALILAKMHSAYCIILSSIDVFCYKIKYYLPGRIKRARLELQSHRVFANYLSHITRILICHQWKQQHPLCIGRKLWSNQLFVFFAKYANYHKTREPYLYICLCIWLISETAEQS
jgi:hypothetical protein